MEAIYGLGQSVDSIKARVSTLSESELLDWLATPIYSNHPELYSHCLPGGLEYVSGPQGLNCFDFAQGCKGKHWLRFEELKPAEVSEGNLIVYFEGNNIEHAGVIIEGGKRALSQWGNGAVFKHGLIQIPKIYGSHWETYLILSSVEN